MTTTNLPRPSPYERGQIAARTLGTLKGLPYGPGENQKEFLNGFQEELVLIARANSRSRA